VAEASPATQDDNPQLNVTPADVVFGLPSPAEVADADSGILLAPRRRIVDRAGRLAPGSLFMLADYALGLAMLRRADTGRISVTGHIHLELAPQAIDAARGVRCVPEMVLVSERSGLAAGRLSVGEQRIGTASARFQLLKSGEFGSPSVSAATVGHNADLASSPLGRSDVIDEMLGIELLEIADDEATFAMRADPALGNLVGGLHGGVTGLIMEQCASIAVSHWAELTPELVIAVELRALFARPLTTDGQTVTVRTTLRHLGRQTAITTTTVYSPTGKESVYGDATYLFADQRE
jgi:uncharacterized protein (TIGR00369 family)